MTQATAQSLDVRPPSRVFKALGDETRLKIVALLAHGELCVCHLEAALQLSQPTASRHLAVLRSAGVVDTRRSGSWVHYRLARQLDPVSRAQLDSLVRAFAADKALKAARDQLLRAKGPKACP